MYWILLALFITTTIVFIILYVNKSSESTAADNKLMSDPPDEKTLKIEFSPVNWEPPAHASATLPPPQNKQKYPVPEHLQKHAEMAKQHISLTRYNYAQEHLQKEPLLTIVTRTFNRPKHMTRNIISCRNMLSKDFEHVILHDEKGVGMISAEAALYAFRHEFKGTYIMHLDDDDYVLNPYFLHEFKNAIDLFPNAKIVICKVWHEPQQRTLPNSWKAFPSEGGITTSNVLTHQSVYTKEENIGVIAQKWAGDYSFIYNILLEVPAKDIFWLNEISCFISRHSDQVSTFQAEHDDVTVDLQGGLGNQMFEVAGGYAYALEHNKRFVLDRSLQVISPQSEVPRPTYFDSVFRDVLGSERKVWNKYQESSFAFESIPFRYGPLKLFGYFQSEKYFRSHRTKILKLFAFQKVKVSLPPKRNAKALYVSVHIRRGDYVNHTFHTSQSWDYYTRALDYIKFHTTRPLELVLFSDDPEWCRTNMPDVMSSLTIHYPDDKQSDVEHLALMTQCDHAILANSSFSWWGAWLNPKMSITVAPKTWFNDETINWQDIYADGWVVL